MKICFNLAVWCLCRIGETRCNPSHISSVSWHGGLNSVQMLLFLYMVHGDLRGICLVSRQQQDIKWNYFPLNWPFVRGIHRSPVNSPHKGQWLGALFSMICAWINSWVNDREAGDLRSYRAHYDVIVMQRQQNAGWGIYLRQLRL